MIETINKLIYYVTTVVLEADWLILGHMIWNQINIQLCKTILTSEKSCWHLKNVAMKENLEIGAKNGDLESTLTKQM